MPTPNTPDARTAQANVATFKRRDAWIRALAADKLSPITRLVGVRLSLHLNCQTGRCDPSYATLAREVGVSERSAIRAIAALEARGWIAVNRSGGGHRTSTNQFHLLMATEGVTVASLQRVTVASSPRRSGVTAVTPRGDTGRQRGVTELCHPISEEKNCKEKSEGENLYPPADQTGLSDHGNNNQDHRLEQGDHYRATHLAVVRPPRADGFTEFWRAYPRRVAKGAAERAYQRIIRKGEATGAELLAGAMRYAAERTGQDDHWTKHPANWLNAECWKDAPAARAPRPRGYLDSIAAGLALIPDETETVQ